MLTQRQIAFIKIFEEERAHYLPSKYFKDQFELSLRTVQTEIKAIKEEFEKYDFVTLQSLPSKGSKLLIQDEEKWQNFVETNLSYESNVTYNEFADRMVHLIKILMQSSKPLTKEQLMKKVYVSSSTITLDLKRVSHYLKRYELELIKRPGLGIYIKGSELKKRQCLVAMGYLNDNLGEHERRVQLHKIESVMIDVLMKHHIVISDNVFQNLIVHVNVSLQRIKSGFIFGQQETGTIKIEEKYYLIAEEIMQQLCYTFQITLHKNEIQNLAVYIQGKRDYDEDNYISAQTNDFVLKALHEIREKFNVDFSDNIDFRLSLALHTAPLIIRIEYDIQIKNELLSYIKQSFPLAFDIAAYYGLLLQKRFHAKIEEGELAYLAIHFNDYLINHNENSGRKNVLIISNIKRSESILLRQRFNSWFDEEMNNLKIVNTSELTNVMLEDYDVIFSTEDSLIAEKMGAILISKFPTEKDYYSIKLAIDGFNSMSEILNLFQSSLFYHGKLSDKNAVIEKFRELLKTMEGIESDQLIEAVYLREDLGSSYFGNHMALPHPINPFSIGSFVGTILLDDPIAWNDEGDKVQLVLLVVIEKNNVQAFQLWNYLSKIVRDDTLIEKLLKAPTYNNFKEKLESLLRDYI